MGSFAEDWRRCLRSPKDNSAWENFLGSQKRIITNLVFRVARRFGVTSVDEIDDAVQEICLKISSQLPADKMANEDDGHLESYTKALIANAAHDYFRGRRAKRRDLLADLPFDGDYPAETSEPKNVEMEVLLNQLQCLAATDERSQQVFRLYYRFGWTAKEIAKIAHLGLSIKGVESLIYRLTLELRDKVQPSPPNRAAEQKGTSP